MKLALLTLATFGCGHAARSVSTSTGAPPVDPLAIAIASRLGTVHHGFGPATAHGGEIVFANSKLALSVSRREAISKGLHVHVLARPVGVAAGAIDACLIGLGATLDESVANAAERYVGLAFPPLAAQLQPSAQVDARPFSGDEPYGVPGYRGFVGALFASRGADGAALAEAALFVGLAPVAPDGRVHLAKVVLSAEQGTWWRTLELDGQATPVAHEAWFGVAAPDGPAMAVRYAVFAQPDTLAHDQARAEVSRILDGRPAWLRDDGCPDAIMPATLIQPSWSSQACAGGRLLECVSECERGRAVSCYGAALEMQKIDAQLAVVQALFMRACRLGHASACTNAAAGRNGLDACSVRTYDRTCGQAGDPWGCTMLGLALAKGEGVTRDLARARTVLRKACAAAEDDPACQAAMSILGQIESGQ
jgi:hypothetical protein